MIQAQINQAFEATAGPTEAGLVGTITVEVYDPTDGTQIIAPTTAGITEPRAGTYRTLLTVSTVGDFKIRWTRDVGSYAEEDVVVSAGAVLPPDEPPAGTDTEYAPTTRQVAAYIKNRTVDEFNNFIGDFTDDTVVTRDEVVAIIDQAEELVLRRLKLPPDPTLPVQPPDLSPETKEAIKNLIALLAASMVELTKFSEQIATGRSAYPHLKELFDEMLGWLATDILGEAAGDQEGSISIWDLVASQSGTARYDFPIVPDNVTWATKF